MNKVSIGDEIIIYMCYHDLYIMGIETDEDVFMDWHVVEGLRKGNFIKESIFFVVCLGLTDFTFIAAFYRKK